MQAIPSALHLTSELSNVEMAGAFSCVGSGKMAGDKFHALGLTNAHRAFKQLLLSNKETRLSTMHFILATLLIAISFQAHAERLLTLEIEDESYSVYDDWNDIQCGILRKCARNDFNPFSKYFDYHSEKEVRNYLSKKMIFVGSARCRDFYPDIFPRLDQMWVRSTKTGTSRILVNLANGVARKFANDATELHDGCPRYDNYMFILFGEVFENDRGVWFSAPDDRLEIFIERIEVVPCRFDRELRQLKWAVDVGSYAFVAGRLAKLGVVAAGGGRLLNADEFCSD